MLHEKYLLTIACIITSSLTFAQNIVVEFEYDDAGNRKTRRVIELPPPNSPLIDSTILNYSDFFGETEIQIFPNPNGGQFKVVISNEKDMPETSISLYSLSGNMIYHQKKASHTTNVDIRKREKGTYILMIKMDGKPKTWKIIKQ